MKKFILGILTIIILTTTAYAQKLTVTMIGHTQFGGSYVAAQAQVNPMSRDQVKNILGKPDKSYGFCDVWIKHDQIYIGYYDMMGQPTSVVLLPVTSW